MKKKIRSPGYVIIFLFLLIGILILQGCYGKSYPNAYKEIIDRFEERVTRDDKHAEDLAKNNDLSGLIKLNSSRKRYVSETLKELIELDPGTDYVRLHALTLYYLVAIEDQIDAQNNYYDALSTGKPSQDLQKIADSMTARVQLVARELSLELSKLGITLKSEPKKSEEKPQSSSPGTQNGSK